MWTFCCYDDGEKIDLWQRWYSDRDKLTRAKHDAAIDRLLQRQGNEWRPPDAKVLEGKLVEIRVTSDIAWRLLGFFGPGRGRFTFVLTCYHKGKVYTPKEAKKTALKRIKAISSGNSKVRSCVRPR